MSDMSFYYSFAPEQNKTQAESQTGDCSWEEVKRLTLRENRTSPQSELAVGIYPRFLVPAVE